MDKEKILEKQQEIIRLAKSFCNEKLDKEYAVLAEKLILKLGRKRDVPFAAGKTEIWAAAIIHALGSINFLFDKSFKPYVSTDDIHSFFGTKKKTIANKAREIRDLLNLEILDKDFSTKKIAKSNPFDKMVLVNDIPAPVDILPKEMQDILRKARAEGRNLEFFVKKTE
jgi:hypothetical protein